jgi:hypothetical protein
MQCRVQLIISNRGWLTCNVLADEQYSPLTFRVIMSNRSKPAACPGAAPGDPSQGLVPVCWRRQVSMANLPTCSQVS